MKSVSGKQLCHALEQHGWFLKRMRGSHHIYSKPGERAIITVPVHGNRNLKIGILRSLLKDAGLTEDDV